MERLRREVIMMLFSWHSLMGTALSQQVIYQVIESIIETDQAEVNKNILPHRLHQSQSNGKIFHPQDKPCSCNCNEE